MKHVRRAVAAITAAGLLTASAAGPVPAPLPVPAVRPNILLIVADDLGYSDLGAFGGEIATPNLDMLAAGGMKLTSLYTAPTCSPTRAMLLTGRDNHEAGFGTMAELITAEQRSSPGYEGRLNPALPTLPERLRDAGYSTLMSGKWHLGGERGFTPNDRGFDRSFALLQGAHNHYGADQGPAYRALHVASAYLRDGKPELYPEGAFSADYFTDQMMEQLRQAPRDRPFFAYLALTTPHWPLQAPPDTVAKYRGRYDAGPAALRAERLARMHALGIVPKTVHGDIMDGSAWWAMSPEDRAIEARKMEIYAAMVDRMDHNIGRILTMLRADRRLADTIVVFISDNGAEGMRIDPRILAPAMRPDNRLANLGRASSFVGYGTAWARVGAAPFRGTKSYVSEGGIRVPAIVAGPGVSPSISTAALHVTDVMPTFLNLALGTGNWKSGNESLPGVSWVPLLQGRVQRVRGKDAMLYWELFLRRSARRGDMKAIFQPNRMAMTGPVTKPGEARWQLYDVAKDPSETHDLAAERPALLARLKRQWFAYAKRVGVIVPPDEPGR